MNQEPQDDYTTLVVMLGLLGYLYIVGILALLGIVLVALLVKAALYHKGVAPFVKITIILGGLIVIVLRALWIKLDPPQGVPLKASQQVPLLDLIGDLHRETGGPVIHAVLITEEFQIDMQRLPRWGFFGPTRNYLTIGLPLLAAMPVTEFTALLAHAYGHFLGIRRSSPWAYRIRRIWSQLTAAFDRERRLGGILLRPFFHWYAPYFERYSFALAREQELAADRLAVSVCGSRDVAAALIRSELAVRRLQKEFWPRMNALADDMPEPPNPYERMPEFFRSELNPDVAAEWLQEAYRASSDETDTHPALRARLKAMKEQPRLPDPMTETAAERLLGRLLPACALQLGSSWKQRVAEEWSQRYEFVQGARARFTTLDARALNRSLNAEELLEHAALTEELKGAEEALPLYEEFIQTHPDSPPGNFALGRILTARGETRGLVLLEQAMAADERFMEAGCRTAYECLQNLGRVREAQEYYQRYLDYRAKEDQAYQDRAHIGVKDTYLPHDLSSEQLEPVQQALRDMPDIARVYLARKEVSFHPERPFYVCGIVRTGGFRIRNDNRRFARGVSHAVELPGDGRFIVLAGAYAGMQRVLKKVPQSLIFHR